MERQPLYALNKKLRSPENHQICIWKVCDFAVNVGRYQKGVMMSKGQRPLDIMTQFPHHVTLTSQIALNNPPPLSG